MRLRASIVAAALALYGCGATSAAEIRVLASNALKTSLEELAPQFEKAGEHKLSIHFNAADELKTEIEQGAAFDIALLGARAADALVAQGKLAGPPHVVVARGRAGMAVKRGAPKPDIGTTEAFKRALLDAKSIAYVERGATGIFLKALLVRLGIADAVKAKSKLLPSSNPAAFAVGNGEAEIGMTQISEILPYPGAELVGQFPEEIQLLSVYPAALATAAKEPVAAQTLVKFLGTPAAAGVFKSKGLDPG
jgi:molybdate transport system substrate-binding protein